MSLQTMDVLVLVGYFALLGVVAWRSRVVAGSSDDYFLAGRGIPAWAAALSFMATALSAATFIGLPAKGYASNLTYIASNLGAFIAVVIVATLFIPAFYQARVRSIYSFLGMRFGAPAAGNATIAFLIGRVFASGARLYIAAEALAYLFTGAGIREAGMLPLALAIAGMVAVAIVYVRLGGIRAVIWTDVCQAGVFITAALVCIAVLLWRIPVEWGSLIEHLQQPGDGSGSKLLLFDPDLTSFDPSKAYSLLGIVLGVSLINLGAYGTDQDLAQRLLTCRDQREGAKSAILAVVIAIPVTFAFVVIGLLLWAYYNPVVMGDALPAALPPAGQNPFTFFVLQGLPNGMAGLICAGLLAAAISGLTSELNAMSSAYVDDIHRRRHPQATDAQLLAVGRRMTVCSGLALGGFAFCSVFIRRHSELALIDYALAVMAYAYSGLVACFLCALLTKRGNWQSATAALITGFGLVLGSTLAGVTSYLAFTYIVFIATAGAFGVCCLGRRPEANA